MELLEDVKEQIFKEVEQEYKEKGTCMACHLSGIQIIKK